MYKFFLKRVLDFVIAFMALLILFPVFIILTIILYFENEGKPFFTQDRPGKDEKIFNVLKFKTMTDKKDENGELLPDIERLTKLGTFVREKSLDEIPQLINVLKGDMSIIGPRPLRTFYLPYYSKIEKKRHTVRPGITGLAQVNGRNVISWDQRFAYDIEYVENLSLFLDFKILIKTAQKVISSSDVAASNENGMDNFDVHRQKEIASGKFKQV